jgi:6,7-dimethyl-8-ribityllumazine synthase
MGKTIEGKLQGEGLRIAIVVSRFNSAVTQRLLDGAIDCLKRLGVDAKGIEVIWVPGAFELPQTARAAAQTGRYDGILPLGCVIRGETPHFDYICQAVTQGLSRLAIESDVPIVYGVLTAESAGQALVRSGLKTNKGAEAAESLIELIGVLRALKS